MKKYNEEEPENSSDVSRLWLTMGEILDALTSDLSAEYIKEPLKTNFCLPRGALTRLLVIERGLGKTNVLNSEQ